MKKIFKKVLAGIMSATLVASLGIGACFTQNVMADDTVELQPWTFMHQGVNNWGEPDNVGIITSAKLTDTDQTISDFPLTTDYKATASGVSTGFELAIANTGWDAQWSAGPNGEDLINPWSVQAMMKDVPMTAGHVYTVSFKAHATQKKYAYVAFGCSLDNVYLAPYDEAGLEEGSDNQIIAIGTVDKTYTYTFTNYVSASAFTTTLMLGAFVAQFDYVGNNISDIVTSLETAWSGTVYVSDFTITDNGLNPNYIEVCNHNYKITVKKPTCTEPGYTTYECTKCGELFTDDYVAPTDHKYIASTIKPTCEEEGYTLHQCSVCGDTYKDNYTVGIGHVFSQKIIKPTCTEDGYTLFKCDFCGETYKDNIVKATGHQYVDTIAKPTVTAQGYTLHTCSKCGDTYKDNYTAPIQNETTTPNNPTKSDNTVKPDDPTKPDKVTVKKTSIKSVKNAKGKKAKISIKKISGINGYEIQYSTNKKFKKEVKKINTKKISYTIKKLKKKQKYYFRVRAYKMVAGKTYYSDWSKAKSLKIKK